MGLTIHYSQGRAKSQLKIDDCINFLEDVAKKLSCKYQLIDEVMTGILEDWINSRNTDNGKRVSVRQKGIVIFPDVGSESLMFTFDYDSLEFCHYFYFEKDAKLGKGGFFCKTQYSKNFLRTHDLICRLLELVKKEYVKGLRVYDDAGYFSKWNKRELRKVYNRWTGIISDFAGKLLKMKGIKFEGAGVELYKDQKLKKMFKK